MQTILDWLKAILSDGRVWGAIIGLLFALRPYLFAAIPETVFNAGIGVLIAVLMATGIAVARQEVRAVRAARAAALREAWAGR